MSKPIEIPAKQKEIIEGLLNRVKNMSDEEFKSMIGSFQKFHNYSFYNKCLIYAHGGSQVAGFNKWKEKNRWVKKKEQHTIGAIQILAPSMVHQIKVGNEAKNVSKKAYEDHQGVKRCFPVSFFAVTVFDIKDTDGQALEETMTPKSNISYAHVESVAKSLGYTVERKGLEFKTGGYISQKHIVINENRQESANVGTMIHELAHGELGHTDTTNEDPYDLNEVQAETVTYMVCQELGIERQSEFYLKAWGMSDNVMIEMAKLAKVADKLIREIRPNSKHFIMAD